MPRDPQGAETRVAIAVVQCTVHGRLAVLVGDTRITPGKCCGSWNKVLHHWPQLSGDYIARALEQFAIPPHAGEETKG